MAAYSYIGATKTLAAKASGLSLCRRRSSRRVDSSSSAALGLVFYQGEMFPAEYRGDGFARCAARGIARSAGLKSFA